MNGDSPQSRSEGTSATNLMATLSLAEKNNTELTGDCRSELTTDYIDVRNKFCNEFGELADYEQQDLVETLLKRMNHHQLGNVDSFIKPLLQRDFIVLLPRNVAEVILKHLDAKSLAMTTGVSKAWRNVVCRGMLWRKLIEKQVQDDSLWSGLSRKRGWRKFLFIPTETATTLIYDARNISHTESQNVDSMELQHSFYRELYPAIRKDIRQIEENWKTGKYRLQRINCQSENSKGVYCLQYDDDKIISGLRDNTIKIWNRSNLQCRQILTGHTGSVLCLQYDGKIIASGSSDATVRIWDVETGAQLNTLIHHSEAVLHLRFHNGMLVTCSKDRSIAVWTMQSSHEIDLRRVLVGHRAAVNVVDFDDTYIVSASGDRTIKVWRTDTCEFIRTLGGHRRGIACLQYRDGLIVSGSSDNNIRLWDIECGTCLRVLDGHEELVRCIRFDNRRIVSGAYDGKIKVWDLQMAMDPRSTTAAICINTLVQHTGRVFRLQFDEFQIVSSSHDDTILIWDFLDTDGPTDAIGIPIAGIGGGGVGIGGGGGDAPGGGGGGINNHFGGGAGGQHHLPPAGGAGAGAGAGQMNGNDEDEAQEHDHDDDEDVMVVADDAAMMDAGQHGDGLNLPGPGPAGPGPLPGGNHPPLHHLPFPLHHHPLAAGGGGGGGGGGGVNIEALQAAGPHVRGMMPGGAPPDEQLQLRNMIHQLQQQQQQPNHQMDWDH